MRVDCGIVSAPKSAPAYVIHFTTVRFAGTFNSEAPRDRLITHQYEGVFDIWSREQFFSCDVIHSLKSSAASIFC